MLSTHAASPALVVVVVSSDAPMRRFPPVSHGDLPIASLSLSFSLNTLDSRRLEAERCLVA